MLRITGYSFVHHDRLGRRGGGIIIYLKNPLKFNFLCSSPQDNFKRSIEYIMGYVKISPTYSIFLAGIYRPPNSAFYKNSEFVSGLTQYSESFGSKIIMGDINANMLSVNPFSNIVNDILSDNDLKLVPHGVTNYNHVSESGIDVCICYSNDQILDVLKTDSPFINSHFLIGFSIPIASVITSTKSYTYRKLDSIRQEDFILDLGGYN